MGLKISNDGRQTSWLITSIPRSSTRVYRKKTASSVFRADFNPRSLDFNPCPLTTRSRRLHVGCLKSCDFQCSCEIDDRTDRIFLSCKQLGISRNERPPFVCDFNKRIYDNVSCSKKIKFS